MKKTFLFLALLPIVSVRADSLSTADDLLTSYKYAYDQYISGHFAEAKDTFKKIALASDNPGLNADSLYYYAQCAFRAGEPNQSVKALGILAWKWPQSSAVQKGYVSRFALEALEQSARIQPDWNYARIEELDDDGKTVFREVSRENWTNQKINFRMGFGFYRILRWARPNDPQTETARQKLEKMLDVPFTVLWEDERPFTPSSGHPADFFSRLNSDEKRTFSKSICGRMFYDWNSEKLSECLVMYDDVRNGKSRFCARTRDLSGVSPSLAEPEVLPFTLRNLFKAAGYNPYTDSFTNAAEMSPADLRL